MTTANMLEAKTRLSQLVSAVESGAGDEIIIAPDGKPAARRLLDTHVAIWSLTETHRLSTNISKMLADRSNASEKSL